MAKVWLRWLVAFVALPVVAAQSLGAADAPFDTEHRPLTRHLGVVMSQIDRGSRSPEYQESLDYLRLHASEAATELSGLVLREPGSFGKWQVTYLIGEFGDENAIALLRVLTEQPEPQVEHARKGSHATDLRYSEEMMSRVQAVSSIARIASHRPELRDHVVETLIAVAQGASFLEDTAMFELQELLGSEFQSLRGYFGPEDRRHFEPFMPPPEWQRLLSRRMQKHQRQERALREKRTPLCQAD